MIHPPLRSRLQAFTLAVVLFTVGGCSLFGALGLKPERQDSVPPELPVELGRDARVTILIFSKTAGFRHEDAIPAADAAVREIAERRGWEVFSTENAAVFTEEPLSRFDVVFGNNNTGDCWTDAQKAAFRGWIERGGGFVGVHGAGGTRYEYWPWYQDVLIGARFVGHPIRPQFQLATLRIESRDDPSTRHLQDRWEREDEWYSFGVNPREKGVNVLATLDETTYSPKALWSDLSMGADHPIIWNHCVEAGRSFYSGLGHKGRYYQEPEYTQLLEAGIAWAAGSGPCRHPIASDG